MTKTIEYPIRMIRSPRPSQKVWALVRRNGRLDASIRFRGTIQKGHYEVSKIQGGSKIPVVCFPTKEEAVDFVY